MNFEQAILWPLTVPYGAVSFLRAAMYRGGILRAKRLDGVVVSVGNLTVGGTGKTPMVAAIAEHWLAEGKRVGILTRGYRGDGAGKGPGDGRGTSDEVQLLKARLGDGVEFGVGADRFARGRELGRRSGEGRDGVEWFLLDDGFQHQQLARDVDMVLIDATNPFGGGHLLPAGRLRERRSALGRADIVVVTRSEHAPAVEAAVRRHTNAPIFYARPQLDYIHAMTGGIAPGAIAPGTIAPGTMAMDAKKWFAFCGIGNPGAFVTDLRAWGFSVVGQRFFRDHHRYRQADIDVLEREAAAAGASDLLCTEKDRFNLAGVRWAPASSVFFCGISMRIEREEEFWSSVDTLIERKRGAK